MYIIQIKIATSSIEINIKLKEKKNTQILLKLNNNSKKSDVNFVFNKRKKIHFKIFLKI